MKKVIALFGSLLILGSTKSKAQNPQPPVKKETVKPTSGTAPKADAVDSYLKLDGVPSTNKGANPAFSKGANPAFSKGANPAYFKGANAISKGAQSVPRQQAVPRQKPSGGNKKILGPR